jgi:hypothetical protein
MYIKVKGIYVKLLLLIPLIILFLGYSLLGRSLYILYQQDNAASSLIALVVCLSLAGVWALPQNLGGIIAALGCLILTFAWAGPMPCAIATVTAAIFAWIGLRDADYGNPDSERNLTWQEWLAVVITILLPLPIARVMLQSLTGYPQSIALGALAGIMAILGPQIKSAELPAKFVFQLLMAIVLLGLFIGWVHGTLTYVHVIPS